MAEVFLARQEHFPRFDKLCVVKKMLGDLVEDPEFVSMFLDEARVAAQLHHDGIAQIFDFGEVKGSYYLAMEYVDGSNLRSIVKDHARRGQLIPLLQAARISALAARALDYAHSA